MFDKRVQKKRLIARNDARLGFAKQVQTAQKTHGNGRFGVQIPGGNPGGLAKNAGSFEPECRGKINPGESRWNPGGISARLLRVWADYALYGKSRSPLPSVGGEPGVDYDLWAYTHVEQFWRDRRERKVVRDHFGKGEPLPRWAYGSLEEYVQWLDEHPIPPVSRPMATEAEETNERQIRARLIDVKTVASLLRVGERRVQYLLERSKLVGWRDGNRHWVTTVGDVLDYAERKQKRKKAS